MATSKKAGLKEYLEARQKVKPSAEVKFAARQEDGSVDEISAKQRYWESMTSEEAQQVNEEFERAVTKKNTTGELLNRIDKIAKSKPEPVITKQVEQVAETIESLQATAEQVDEQIGEFVELPPVDDAVSLAGPLTSSPQNNAQPEVSETALLIQAIEKLVDKIDQMQNFTPVIHVPAPVIHVTLPETRRTVTKAIERDENNLIKSVTESIEEKPIGDPEVIVIKEDEEN